MPNDPGSERALLERVIEERERYFTAKFSQLEGLIADHDKLYASQFKAAEGAVGTALAAAEKAVNAAFSASEKAVLKAEQAQKEYNERSNEFRGQLDDQAKTLMPRPETLNMFKALEEKITGVANVADSKFVATASSVHNEFNSLKEAVEKSHNDLQAQVNSLRESRAGSSGKWDGISASWGIVVAVLGIALTVMWIYIASRPTPTPQVYYAAPASAK